MRRRERVLQALSHHRVPVVPWNIELTMPQQEKVAVQAGIGRDDFVDFSGSHIEKAGYNTGFSIKDGLFRDEFGVAWDRSGPDRDIGIIREFLIKQPSLDGYKFPVPDIEHVRNSTQKLLDNGRGTFKLGKIGTAYFERAWSLTGMEELMINFHANPVFVEELFDHILEFNMQIIDEALRYAIDGIYFGDDYGQQNGLLMSPDTWRRFIRGGLAKMFEKIKDAGKIVVLHSCGNISEIMPDMLDIGLDVYQTVQPEVYDLKKLKRRFGGNLAFWGGISTQRTLPFVTPDRLKKLVRETIEIMGTDGGYIAAPTHRIPRDVPMENIHALIEILKHQ